MEKETFRAELQKIFTEIFPNSFVKVSNQHLNGEGFNIIFAILSKDEWINHILENDPVYHLFVIDKNKDGSFTIDVPIGSIHRYDGSRIKTGWRKKSNVSEEKILEYLKKYLLKLRENLKELIKDMNQSEIIKTKI